MVTPYNPEHPPAAGVLADMCAIQALNESLDFDTRRLLEWSAETIRAILIANGRYANRSEHLEAYCHTLLAQKGGAA